MSDKHKEEPKKKAIDLESLPFEVQAEILTRWRATIISLRNMEATYGLQYKPKQSLPENIVKRS